MGYGLPASVGCCFAPNVRKVVSVNGQYITVKFESVQKVFVYPDIFEKFLNLRKEYLFP